MGKHCKLCKIEAVKGGERSFHRFPDPQYQREAWCQALDVNIKMLKNWTFVCSDHFPPESFIYRSNGQRFLKDDAVPFPYKGQLKRIGRRKKGYKKRSLIKNVVTIKTECEEQEILNADLDRAIKVETPLDREIKVENPLDREIKVESPDYLEGNEEVFEQKYCSDIPVKKEVITEREICDFESEEITIKQSEIDIDDNIVDIQCNNIPETSNVNYSLDQMNSDEEKEDILPKLFKLSYPELPSDGVYLCKECSFQTTFNQNLRKHFIGHREAEFRNDPEKFKEYKSYSCKQCSYITIRRYNLSRHMIKHLPNDGKAIKIYSCDECDYSTKYRCDIVKHRVKHVPIGQRFGCTKCSYKAYDKGHLKEHIEKGHLENKQYKYECEHCPYKTDSKGALHRHIRESHSENKPFKYQCKYCSFKIDSKGSFNRHMKHGHSEASSLPVHE